MKNLSMVIVVALAFGCLSFAADRHSSVAAGVAQPNTVSPAVALATAAKTSIAPGEGSPIPYCPPHQPCPDDLRLMAGEGSPIPYCPPHQPCPDDFRLMAGEGSPIPHCPPHQPCPDDLRVTASLASGGTDGLYLGENRQFATNLSLIQVRLTATEGEKGEVRQIA
ncbi:MAG TPA: hypothetical protein VFB04_14055 [Terriglobales bacterium]|nr:hypothetical protein [Terriglobales bacterium]